MLILRITQWPTVQFSEVKTAFKTERRKHLRPPSWTQKPYACIFRLQSSNPVTWSPSTDISPSTTAAIAQFNSPEIQEADPGLWKHLDRPGREP